MPLNYTRSRAAKARNPIHDNYLDLQKLDEEIGGRVQQAKDAVRAKLENENLPEELAWIKNKQAWDRARQRGLFKTLNILREKEMFAEALSILTEWEEQNRILHRKKVALVERLLARRRSWYSQLAAFLARTYGKILLPEIDTKAMIETKDAEKSYALRHGDRYHQIAATHDLKQLIVQAAAKWSTEVVQKESAFKTAKCNRCGTLTEASPKLMRECGQCGARWDVDAVRNILGKEQDPAFTPAIPRELEPFLVRVEE